jgi:hypothetical protein
MPQHEPYFLGNEVKSGKERYKTSFNVQMY